MNDRFSIRVWECYMSTETSMIFPGSVWITLILETKASLFYISNFFALGNDVIVSGLFQDPSYKIDTQYFFISKREN